jgi:hypothetical protein
MLLLVWGVRRWWMSGIGMLCKSSVNYIVV